MNEIDWTLLDRYASGECDADEAAAVQRWALGHPEREALLASLERAAAAASSQFSADAAWQALRIRAMVATEPRLWWRRSASVLLRAAALAAVLVGGVLVARMALNQQRGAGALQVASTGRGESDTLRLDDGSFVILSPASALEYPRSFQSASREVRLTGVAFFRVAPDTARPFRVIARNAVVQVVGTEFIVRTTSARDTAGVTVAVTEGKVAVGALSAGVDQRAHVERGQVAEVARDGVTTVVNDPGIDRYTAWMSGTLVFENATLAQLLTELERWYAVEFRTEGAGLPARRVTARLQAGSLVEALDALTLALGAHHRRAGDTIFISQNQP